MPAGSEPPQGGPPEELPELPVRLRPLGVRVAFAVFGVMLIVAVVVTWLSLPPEAQDGFTIWMKGTVAAMILAGAAVGHALARCRVDADAEGLTVVNGYRTHRLTWPQVVAVHLRPGNPWAVLDLSDGTTRAAMGIQGSDGARAHRQARLLKRLVEAHLGDEPPRR